MAVHATTTRTFIHKKSIPLIIGRERTKRIQKGIKKGQGWWGQAALAMLLKCSPHARASVSALLWCVYCARSFVQRKDKFVVELLEWWWGRKGGLYAFVCQIESLPSSSS